MIVRGIDLDGIHDRAVDASIDERFGTIASREVLGGIARRPKHRGERWIAGNEARGSLVPSEIRARSPFVFVRDAVRNVIDPSESLDVFGEDTDDGQRVDPEEVLDAHLRSLGPTMADRTVLAVSDRADIETQDRLLRAVRSAAFSNPELLWRPIAGILSWSQTLAASRIEELHGSKVVYLHLGALGIEVSTLGLRAERHQRRTFLVPVRSGRGRSLQESAMLVEGVYTAIASDLERHGLAGHDVDDDVIASLAADERPWLGTLGFDAPDAIVATRSGALARISGSLPRAVIGAAEVPHEILSDVAAVARNASATLLVEGVMTQLHTTQGLFSDQVTARLHKLGADPIYLPSHTVAEGAAIYAWRRSRGYPTYEDLLPTLQILATTEGEFAWIDIVPPGQRIAGGSTFGPRRVHGFYIAQGASKVPYAITREGDPTVRLTTTMLPIAAPRTMEIDLVVTQTPGQGSASVEVMPLRGAADFGVRVYLDWRAMEDTELEREAYLAEERANARFAFPPHGPLCPASELWEDGVFRAPLRAVLRESSDVFSTRFLTSLQGLQKALTRRPIRLDGSGFDLRMVGSDGSVPLSAGFDGRSGEEWRDALAWRLSQIIGSIRSNHGGNPTAERLFRAAILTGSWLYARAPKESLAFARTALSAPERLRGVEVRNERYGWNVAGRAFVNASDVDLAFNAVLARFQSHCDWKNYEMKALQEIFRYRKDSHRALSAENARRLACAAVTVLDAEVRTENLHRRFFNASALLIGLLRYRITDPTFLAVEPSDAASQTTSERNTSRQGSRVRVNTRSPRLPRCCTGEGTLSDPLLHLSALAVLDRARKVAARIRPQYVELIEQMKAYLQSEGSDALLFVRLMDGD